MQTPLYLHTPTTTINLPIWGTDMQEKHGPVLCVLSSLPPHPSIFPYLPIIFQPISLIHCNHSFSLTHCFPNLPQCVWRESTAWLHCNRILKVGVGKRAECLGEVGQVYGRSRWSPPSNRAPALIKQMEMRFDRVPLRRCTIQCSATSSKGTWASQEILTSSSTSVLWLQDTGMVVGIWAMPGRWLLVPVLGFKLNLQSEKQRPWTSLWVRYRGGGGEKEKDSKREWQREIGKRRENTS